jgi:hypothetical protein
MKKAKAPDIHGHRDGLAEEGMPFSAVPEAVMRDPLGKPGRFADMDAEEAQAMIVAMDKAFAEL